MISGSGKSAIGAVGVSATDLGTGVFGVRFLR
jgi:hypothetical protein